MILANGCPKSGTHALMAWLGTLGLHRAPGILKAAKTERARYLPTPEDPEVPPWDELPRHADFVHTHAPPDVELPTHRAVVVVRRDPRNVLISYVRDPRTDATTPEEGLADFYGQSFVDLYRRYLGWCGSATVVDYDELVAPPIGETYTGAPSDWRNWWTDEVAAAWEGVGGPELAGEAGYA